MVLFKWKTSIVSRSVDGSLTVKQLGDIDRHVGARLRERRILLGMTQKELAKMIGITSQQVQKYETGQDSIAAGRLWAFAAELGVGLNYFFHRVGEGPFEGSTHQQRALLELCRNFSRIQNLEHRAGICEMARTLASAKPDA
jgi:transcriptional regulator with XRE-family HTH domain